MNRHENTQGIIDALKEIMAEDVTLLPLQRQVLEQFIADPEHPQTGIFDLATGFGKTCLMGILTAACIKSAPTARIVVVVPTQTLVKNTVDGGHLHRLRHFFTSFNQRFSSDPLDIGVFYAAQKEPSRQVIVTTYDSLGNLAQLINPENVGLLLLDEAHHAITEKRKQIIQSFSNAAQYGLTATPYYSPDKNLSTVLEKTIAQVDVKKAIQAGMLSNVRNILMVSDMSLDLSRQNHSQTEYSDETFQQAVERAIQGTLSVKSAHSGNIRNWEEFRRMLAQDVALFYQNYVDENLGALQGKRCIINCRTQQEADLQARTLNDLFGRQIAGAWTSDSPDKTVLQQFSTGQLSVICQVGKLAEGFDDPSVQICINYPTMSRVLEAQRSGRVLHKLPHLPKEALVVDLCFRHPDARNDIYGIRRNNQQIYMDILQSPAVRCEQIPMTVHRVSTAPKHAGPQLSQNIHLHGFHIESNPEQLLRLSNEADQLMLDASAANIRPGMLTSTALHKKYGINASVALSWLNDAAQKNEVFYLKTDPMHQKPIPLVEAVKALPHPCTLALHEAPEASQKFEELHPLLLKALKKKHLPEIRDGMLTSKKLNQTYGTDAKTVATWLHEAWQTNQFFYLVSDAEQNNPIPLVERVRTGSQVCEALHEAPEARQKFEELYPQLLTSKQKRQVPPIRPGMLTSVGLRRNYGVANHICADFLRKSFENGEVFYQDSDPVHQHPLPVVEKVRINGQTCYAVHESEEAKRKFEELHPQLQKALQTRQTPEKREGMLTCNGINEIYGTDMAKVSDWFKQDLANEECFYFASDINHTQPIPLVEYIRTGPQSCLALHEAPEARQKFEQLHPELARSLQLKQVPPIRPGMATTVTLYHEYGVKRAVLKQWLQQAQDEHISFYAHSDQEHKNPLPLVERVRTNGQACHALHEAPEAKQKFEELHPELLSAQKIKRLPAIRPDMWTSTKLYKHYRTSDSMAPAQWLLKAYQDHVVFYSDTDPEHKNPIPLVEYVKSVQRPCHALHEGPEAVNAFEQWYQKTYGKELEKRSMFYAKQPLSNDDR